MNHLQSWNENIAPTFLRSELRDLPLGMRILLRICTREIFSLLDTHLVDLERYREDWHGPCIDNDTGHRRRNPFPRSESLRIMSLVAKGTCLDELQILF